MRIPLWLLLILFLIAIVCLVTWFGKWFKRIGYSRLLFHPPRPMRFIDGEDEYYRHTGRNAYWMKEYKQNSNSANTDNCEFTKKRYRRTRKIPITLIIYLHGRAGNIETSQAYFTELRKYFHDPCVCVAPEYPGYCPLEWGRVKATPTSAVESARDVIRHVQKMYPKSRLVFIGRSIGTGVACALANDFPELRRLVLVSPFQSIQSLAREHFKPRAVSIFLPNDIFDNEREIAKLSPRLPILFLHGVRDWLIPYSHSEMLHDASCSRTKYIIKDASDHININHATRAVAIFISHGSCRRRIVF